MTRSTTALGLVLVLATGLLGCEGSEVVGPESDLASTAPSLKEWKIAPTSILPPTAGIDEYVNYWRAQARITVASLDINLGDRNSATEFIMKTRGDGPTPVNTPLYYVSVGYKLSHSYDGEAQWVDASGSHTWPSSMEVPLTAMPPNAMLTSPQFNPLRCMEHVREGSASGTSQHHAQWHVTVNPIGEEANAVTLDLDDDKTNAADATCPIRTEVEPLQCGDEGDHEAQTTPPVPGASPQTVPCGGGSGSGGSTGGGTEWCMVRFWYDAVTGEILDSEILYCWTEST